MWNLKHFTHDNNPQVAPVLLPEVYLTQLLH